MGGITQSHYRPIEKKVIETLLETKSQSATSRLLKIGRSTIRLVMEQAVERGMSLRDKDRIYEHLCIDEKSYQKHHRYGSILYDEDGTVIDVVEGRSKDSVRELFAGCLSPKQRMKSRGRFW